MNTAIGRQTRFPGSKRVSGLALVVAAGLACARHPAENVPTRAADSAADKAPATKTYPLRGEIISVDRRSGAVSIRHEEIAGFMPAMTMPFSLKGQDILEDLQAGDRVEGKLRIRGDESDLIDLTVTEMATPTFRLDTSGGSATLRAARPVLKPGEAVPDFSMTTQDGKTLRLSDLRGDVVALTFIYTRCPVPDFCPLMDQKFATLAQRIAVNPDRERRVRLISVSFDPEHDTPEVLARHARLRGAKPPLWAFAVAGHEELRKVAEPLGLMYGPTPNEIVHSLSTAIIAPDGTLARLDTGNKWTPDDIFKTIVGLLKGTPQKRA
jgi:protein SCO1/2